MISCRYLNPKSKSKFSGGDPSHVLAGISTCFLAIPGNNAIKTVQQSAKDKEGICRRANARQRYLTQDFTL